MTDNKLLQLAANAAGMVYSSEYGCIFCQDADGNSFEYDWNPLTNDGDALRLAVKLGFNVSCDIVEDNETTVISEGGRFTCENHKGDPYAATRRAIVRAAAEIGRTK